MIDTKFKEIDADGNGEVDSKELGDALKNGKI